MADITEQAYLEMAAQCKDVVAHKDERIADLRRILHRARQRTIVLRAQKNELRDALRRDRRMNTGDIVSSDVIDLT